MSYLLSSRFAKPSLKWWGSLVVTAAPANMVYSSNSKLLLSLYLFLSNVPNGIMGRLKCRVKSKGEGMTEIWAVWVVECRPHLGDAPHLGGFTQWRQNQWRRWTFRNEIAHSENEMCLLSFEEIFHSIMLPPNTLNFFWEVFMTGTISVLFDHMCMCVCVCITPSEVIAWSYGKRCLMNNLRFARFFSSVFLSPPNWFI